MPSRGNPSTLHTRDVTVSTAVFVWISARLQLAGWPHCTVLYKRDIFVRGESLESQISSRKMAVNSADQEIVDQFLECDSELEDISVESDSNSDVDDGDIGEFDDEVGEEMTEMKGLQVMASRFHTRTSLFLAPPRPPPGIQQMRGLVKKEQPQLELFDLTLLILLQILDGKTLFLVQH